MGRRAAWSACHLWSLEVAWAQCSQAQNNMQRQRFRFQPVPIALCAVRFGQLPGQLLRPFSIGYVKGWRRSVAALIVMQGFKELDIDLDTLPRPIRVS